jgi:hypothetical protein
MHSIDVYRIQAHDLYSFVPFLDHTTSSDVLNEIETSFLLPMPSPLHYNSHKYNLYFVHLQLIGLFILPEVLHILYTRRFLPLLTGSQLCASWRPEHHRCEVHTNFADESICLLANNVQNEVRSYNSQNTEGAENAVPLRTDTPCTSRRNPDLPFEAVLQEYLQFPTNILF